MSTYTPAAEEKVFPPSFPTEEKQSEYLYEKRRLDGELMEVVVLDQVPSQANRVEAALLEARDCGRIHLPLFELRTTASDGSPVRLTSLDFPHRFADAYLRDSRIGETPFDKTPIGQKLRSATAADVRPLFEYSPESLVLGAWDSHRKGRQLKVARAYSSTVVGLDPDEGRRRGGRFDPLNLQGVVAHTGEGWDFVAPGEKKPKTKGEKLSELGHGHIRPNPDLGGVAISQARRSGWISLSGLGNLRFGDAEARAANLARATLAALALAGDRLAFDTPSLWLRSGCDLVRTGQKLVLEGEKAREVEVGAADAIEAFHELREMTAQAGIAMSSQTVELSPNPALAKAIDYALTRSEAAEAE
jgi:CRISPR-associated protein Csb1